MCSRLHVVVAVRGYWSDVQTTQIWLVWISLWKTWKRWKSVKCDAVGLNISTSEFILFWTDVIGYVNVNKCDKHINISKKQEQLDWIYDSLPNRWIFWLKNIAQWVFQSKIFWISEAIPQQIFDISQGWSLFHCTFTQLSNMNTVFPYWPIVSRTKSSQNLKLRYKTTNVSLRRV